MSAPDAPDTTARSEVGTLRRVLLGPVRALWASQDEVDGQWEELGYRARPDLERARAEHDAFRANFRERGIEVCELTPLPGGTGLDAVYVRDASVVTDRGVVLCAMGKPARAGEPHAHAMAYRGLGIPVLGAVQGPGTLEGGDVVWLGPGTLAAGHGYRTNLEGIRQLEALLGPDLDELLVVPLPHWKGPGDVFHLMSMLSPVDRDLALVYSPLLPVPFRQELLRRGMELVETPDDEFLRIGANVLALGPREVLMPDGLPGTRANLERAGVAVRTYPAAEISLKGCGGPTCLTRPLLRDALPG